MGLNYWWFKKSGHALPHQRVFNHFFKTGDCDSGDIAFNGVNFMRPISDKFYKSESGKAYCKRGERYHLIPSLTDNILGLICAVLPILLGCTGALLSVLFIFPALYSETMDYPWLFLIIVLSWNLFFLNFTFLRDIILSPFKGAYIDRQNQTISFTWRVKGNPEKNEFGHATFPLADIDAFYSLQLKNQHGGSTYTLCLAHKDHDTYGGAFLQIPVRDNAGNPNYCRMEWEYLLRFADNTRPLPDIPDIEKFRHLDPITAAIDKKNQRPEFYWRKMHVMQQVAIKEDVESRAYAFNFDVAYDNPKKYANKEIDKPWLEWPIRRRYFDDDAAIPLWRKKANRLFRQLTLGLN